MQSFAHEIDWLKSRISQDPASMFYARLADMYLKNNDLFRAVEFAEKGALLHPHDVTARFVLAKCHYVKNDLEKADKNLADVLALEPLHPGALDLHAELFSRRGDFEQAKETLDQLINIDPFNDAVYQKVVDLRAEPAPVPEEESFEDDWNVEFESKPDQSIDEFESPVDESSDYESEVEKVPDWSDNSFAASRRFESDDEDPFSDFVETTPLDESTYEDEYPSTEEKMVPDVEEEEETQPPAARQREVEDDFSSEEFLDESVDDDFEIDRSKFREEKSKFTRLLDDIFSSSLDDEEQRENEQRSAIERLAEEQPPQADEQEAEDEPFFPDMKDDDFQPLMSRDDIASPEEKILESDRKQHDDYFDRFDRKSEKSDDFFRHEDELKNAESADKSKTRNEDFSSFLDSLDIQDDSITEKEFPKDFDDPMTNLDDDFELSEDLKNILEPLSENEDDWMRDLSQERSRDAESDELDDDMNQEFGKDADVETEREKARDSAHKDKDKGKFYTPTLGEIYAAQGQYAKAISVYETLMKNDPENEWYQSKLDYLRKKLAEQQ